VRQFQLSLAAVVAIAAIAPSVPVASVPVASAAVNTVLEAESMTILPAAAGKVIADGSASGGSALSFLTNSSASKSISLPASTTVVVKVKGQQCLGAPNMTLTIDSKAVGTTSVANTAWAIFTVTTDIPAGVHTVTIAYTNDTASPLCDRILYVDALSFVPSAASTAPLTPVIGNGVVGGCGGSPLLGLSDADLSRELNVAASGGLRSIRVDVDWAAVEPTKGQRDWTNTDRVINAITSRGMTPLGVITFAPKWASGSSNSHTAPTDPAVFAAFARDAAARYLGRIPAWEVWNEPNIVAFYTPKPNVASYAKLLTASYAAIKSVSAGLTVISGGLSPAADNGTDIAPETFLKGLYAAGANKSFDAVGMHPYTFPALPNDPSTALWSSFQRMSSMRDIMVAGGDSGKGIWLTEFGAPTGTGSRAVSESVQAQTVQIVLQAAKDTPWIGPAFVYSMRDVGNNKGDIEQNFGVLRYDFSPKPAAAILQQFALMQ
jgi:polysaccharide biosynthesis protein PslG